MVFFHWLTRDVQKLKKYIKRYLFSYYYREQWLSYIRIEGSSDSNLLFLRTKW